MLYCAERRVTRIYAAARLRRHGVTCLAGPFSLIATPVRVPVSVARLHGHVGEHKTELRRRCALEEPRELAEHPPSNDAVNRTTRSSPSTFVLNVIASPACSIGDVSTMTVSARSSSRWRTSRSADVFMKSPPKSGGIWPAGRTCRLPVIETSVAVHVRMRTIRVAVEIGGHRNRY